MPSSKNIIIITIALFWLPFSILIGQGNVTQIKKAEDLYSEGKRAYYGGEYLEARKLFESCAKIRNQELEFPHEDLYKVNNRLMRCNTQLRELIKAKKYGYKALDNAKGAFGEDSEEVALIFNNLALVSAKSMLVHEAIDYSNQAIEILKNKYGENSIQVAYYVMNIANSYSKYGDYNKALEEFKKAQKIYDENLKENDENFNRLYLGMSNAFRKKGDLQRALEYGEKALRIKLANYNENHPSVTKYYFNLSKIQSSMENFDDAEKTVKKIIESEKQNDNVSNYDKATSISDLARPFIEYGDPERALPYLLEAKRLISGYELDAGRAVWTIDYNLSLCKFLLGNEEEAIKSIEGIIDRLIAYEGENVYEIADNYIQIGQFHRKRKDKTNALIAFAEAEKWLSNLIPNAELELIKIDLSAEQGKALALGNVKEDLIRAGKKIDSAIESLISLRKKYQGSFSKNFINDELANIFDDRIEIAYHIYDSDPALSNLEDIYTNIEKAKAAAFWDNESEENAYFLGNVPKNIIANIEFIKQEISIISRELSNNKNFEEKGEYKDSLFVLNENLNMNLERLEKDYPEYYNQKYELKVPSIQEIQSRLSKDIAVIDYFLLNNNLIYIIITKDEVKIGKSELSQKIILELASGKKSLIGPLDEQLKVDIYDQILKEQLAQIGGNIKRLAIVPDKFLNYISFEQLANAEGDKPLIYNYAFSYQNRTMDLVSSSRKSSGRKKYLGFAPKWESKNTSEYEISRSQGNLIPLPGALSEINQTAKIFDGQKLIEKEANEINFREQASDYNILHFATHAYSDASNELNSCLFLHNENSLNDGRLYSNEITDTKLNAEMVILSACNTGNGKFQNGEGVMSLSRAFRYAGAKSVVMSLWLANDQSSIPIITDFMKFIKAGVPKDIALQRAKIKYLENSDPLMKEDYYWAGFILNGNVNKISVTSFSRKFVYPIIGFLIILIGGLTYQNLKKKAD